jgi:hypothetical protein
MSSNPGFDGQYEVVLGATAEVSFTVSFTACGWAKR